METRSPYVEDNSGKLVLAILAALGAAVGSGVIWGLVSKLTKHEIGIVAVGVGFIVGAVVAYAGKGAGSTKLQVIAAIGALLGIAIGKYLEVLWIGSLGFGSSLAWDIYTGKLGHLWDFFDLLWAGIAVYQAIRLAGASFGRRIATVPAFVHGPKVAMASTPPPPEARDEPTER
ncbi:MAG TPA: hypothetical protein VGM80_01660 [Gaiellaceae bacterium]|jgi:hypothetical protein